MCYTWIRNILHECINRLDSERSFPLKKMYDIYFFFPLLYAFFFFLWGRGQVGLLVLIYDNYLRYSTSILVLYYIYLHIIYISYNFRVCSRSRCANGKTTQYGLSMWKSKEKTRKEPGPHPFQVYILSEFTLPVRLLLWKGSPAPSRIPQGAFGKTFKW